MDYRMVAVDMDGTLLDSSKNITRRTADAVRRAGEKGISVCLSTGRPLCGVRRYIDLLALRSPVITCNGAVIASAETGEVLFRQCVEPEAAGEVWRCGQEFATTICAWVGNRLYVNKVNDRTEAYKKISGIEPEVILDFESIAGAGISKMLWYDTPENISRFRTVLDRELNCGVSYLTSNPSFLEIFDSRVSKAKAMEYISRLLGISHRQMIAIGNGENDLSMLEYAGLGVAMGNAPEAVRARCGHVTASNDEDGAALVIERFCLDV